MTIFEHSQGPNDDQDGTLLYSSSPPGNSLLDGRCLRKRKLLAFYTILFVVGVLSQGNNVNKQRRNVATLIPQCFHEGRWFPGGTIITAGRSLDWCFGSFCDMNGKIKHWDDYNCPPPNRDHPFSIILSQQKKPTTTTMTTTTTPMPVTRPPTTTPPVRTTAPHLRATAPPVRATTPPSFWFPSTTQEPFFNSFSDIGCFYRGKFYWAGQDIENKQRGRRCFGTYCDFNGRIQHWQDDCLFTMSPLVPLLSSADQT